MKLDANTRVNILQLTQKVTNYVSRSNKFLSIFQADTSSKS